MNYEKAKQSSEKEITNKIDNDKNNKNLIEQIQNNKDIQANNNNNSSIEKDKIENDKKKEKTEIEINLQPNPITQVKSDSTSKKRKKDWRSWSSEEKILFYEIIANGGNYTSLQKLFKTINDKIGTKSTEKIRDYYYRMLKNVNTLLKSEDEIRLNQKNRDEVILAISCYGKLLTSSGKTKKLDMKKLNKHPRLFKRIANTLKKLIMNKIKQVRTKMINNKSSKQGTSKSAYATRATHPALRAGKVLPQNDFTGVINLDTIRSIPYDTFILRITPYDQETYLKMIEANLSSRLEINVNVTKPIKYIIDVLCEKWKNVQKKNSRCTLYLIPLAEIWIPNELTIFSSADGKAYDIGDIFTSYGSPSTNVLYMKYQWSETRKEKNDSNEAIFEGAKTSFLNQNSKNISVGSEMDIRNGFLDDVNQNSNCAIKNDNSSDDDLSDDDDNDNDNEQEKSFLPLESELNVFDPLEFLGIDDERKNSTDDEKYSDFNQNNYSIKTPSLKKTFHSKRPRSDDGNVSFNNIRINNNQGTNSKLRTGYSELFSQKTDNGNLIVSSNPNNSITVVSNNGFSDTNLNQISSHINSSNLSQGKTSSNISKGNCNNTKKRIPFINNVKKEDCVDIKNITQKTETQLSPCKTKKEKTTPKKNVINSSSMLMPERQLSNFGLTSLFPQESMMNNNNVGNTRLLGEFEMSNYMTQNSANFNSIFDHGNNTNLDFFKNNYTASNIFKSEFNKNSNFIKDKDNLNDQTLQMIKEEKENDNDVLNKKTRRKREKKKKEKKITIEEIEESEKKQKQTKNKKKIMVNNNGNCNTAQIKNNQNHPYTTLNSNISNPYIINQNNYFTNYPAQYYQPQIPLHLDIPLPSKFMEEKPNISYMYSKPTK